jgi:hypothetical protein
LRRALACIGDGERWWHNQEDDEIHVACRQQSNKAAAGDHRSFKLIMELLRQLTGRLEQHDQAARMAISADKFGLRADVRGCIYFLRV